MGNCQDDSLNKDKLLKADQFIECADEVINKNYPQSDNSNDSPEKEGTEIKASLDNFETRRKEFAIREMEAAAKRQEAAVERLNAITNGIVFDTDTRRKMAWAIYWLVLVYVATVMCVLFLDGFGLVILPDSVLITMLSTTTANVLGVLVIVATYYFASKNRSKKNK